MQYKQDTFGDILDSEKEMVIKGCERYGKFCVNASEFNSLLNSFLKSIDRDRYIFAAFLSQVRKHHTLALFSALRLHHVQAMLNLRYALEAGACAAYAIANPDPKDFADVDECGLLNPSKKLAEKRYEWLNKNFEAGSKAIQRIKKNINDSAAHSNIVYAYKNFNFNIESKKFDTPFFDIEDDLHVKTDLWMIGNIAMGLMDLFYGVNKGLNVIKFIDDHVSRYKALEQENMAQKEEMINNPRVKLIKNKIDGTSPNTG